MSNIICPLCKAEVPSDTVKCPKCGKILIRQKWTTARKSILWLCVLFNLLLLAWVIIKTPAFLLWLVGNIVFACLFIFTKPKEK